jgi:hypothetical protein
LSNNADTQRAENQWTLVAKKIFACTLNHAGIFSGQFSFKSNDGFPLVRAFSNLNGNAELRQMTMADAEFSRGRKEIRFGLWRNYSCVGGAS